MDKDNYKFSVPFPHQELYKFSEKFKGLYHLKK